MRSPTTFTRVPRYLVETLPFDGDPSRLVALAGARFPEVSLERRYSLAGEPARDTWVCRSATDHHIRRFAQAAGLSVEAIHRIDADVVLAAPSADSRRAR